MDRRAIDVGDEQRRIPSAPVTATVKESGGRIAELSYSDMVSLAGMLAAELELEGGSPFKVAEALLAVATRIESAEASDKIVPRTRSKTQPPSSNWHGYK